MSTPSDTGSRYGLGVALAFTAYLSAGFIAWLVGYLLGDSHPLLVIGAADFAATVAIFVWSVSFDNTSMYDPYWSLAPVPIALYLGYDQEKIIDNGSGRLPEPPSAKEDRGAQGLMDMG